MQPRELIFSIIKCAIDSKLCKYSGSLLNLLVVPPLIKALSGILVPIGVLVCLKQCNWQYPCCISRVLETDTVSAQTGWILLHHPHRNEASSSARDKPLPKLALAAVQFCDSRERLAYATVMWCSDSHNAFIFAADGQYLSAFCRRFRGRNMLSAQAGQQPAEYLTKTLALSSNYQRFCALVSRISKPWLAHLIVYVLRMQSLYLCRQIFFYNFRKLGRSSPSMLNLEPSGPHVR